MIPLIHDLVYICPGGSVKRQCLTKSVDGENTPVKKAKKSGVYDFVHSTCLDYMSQIKTNS